MVVIGQSRVTVAPQVIEKSSRLFNAGIKDILNELFQNARRAGATRINISITRENEVRCLSVEDNGKGIFSDGVNIALGGSGWDEQIQNSEDPFGGGLFSLAHRSATLEGSGKRVHLTPDQFEAKLPFDIEEAPERIGTRISFPVFSEETNAILEKACASAALYFPLPVHYHGGIAEQRDFLSGAMYREVWEGIEIGVFERGVRSSGAINFYGVVVEQALPTVSMVFSSISGSVLCVKANVLDAPRLKLVLPARKEVFDDAFFKEFKIACERAIYRAISQLPTHTLPFSSWRKAQSLGVALPEAKAALEPFIFPVADSSDWEWAPVKEVPENAVVVVADMEPPEAQTIVRTLLRSREGGVLTGDVLFAAVPDYCGYSWYDALPEFDEFSMRVEHNGERLSSHDAIAKLKTGTRVERIVVSTTVSRSPSDRVTEEYHTDMLIYGDPEFYWGLDQAHVFLTNDADIEIDELTAFLFGAFFYASEDSDADSYDTQKAEFEQEARSLAISLLVSEADALKARLADAAERHLGYLAPKGQKCVITIDRDAWAFDVSITSPTKGMH